ncbi:MAG: ABC transporter ATP-binding protein, partial [Bacteroidota bacterium]
MQRFCINMRGNHDSVDRLAVVDVGHRFGRQVLFGGVTFEVAGGDSVAITGSNGSGKSTLLHILAGLLTPVRGLIRLTVDGRDISAEDRPFQCGMVAPYLNVYEGFSVFENLLFVARSRGLSDRRRRIAEAIDAVGLTPRAHDLVGTFSSGMKQRVKFAIVIMVDLAVLLLDEPATNLDAAGREMVAVVRQRQTSRGGMV